MEIGSSVLAHATIMGSSASRRLLAMSSVDRRTKRIRGRHCRVCKYNTDKWGYPRIAVHKRTLRANRVAFVVGSRASIPSGRMVLHRCDRRACIEYKHLYAGTAADNMNDKVARKRQARGTHHGMAKLSNAQVRAVYRMPGLHWAVARHFRVHRSLVSQIKRGDIWKHVTKHRKATK